MTKPLAKTQVIPLSQEKIAELFEILASYLTPKSELNWKTPLDLVIAVVLSAQCTDKAVNKGTAELWKTCRSPDDYIQLGEEEIKKYIRSIGLFRNKTKAIIGICRIIKEKFNYKIPSNRKDLELLPGVGRKTANVVLNVVFGQPTLAVDTHIFRVANRMGLSDTRTPEATEKVLIKKIPKKYLKPAHHYLILHGRYTCKARKPECWRCKVRDCCNYPHKEEKRP